MQKVITADKIYRAYRILEKHSARWHKGQDHRDQIVDAIAYWWEHPAGRIQAAVHEMQAQQGGRS